MTLEERNAALDRAKALVLAGWTQGTNARDQFGTSTAPVRKNAVAFCANGAILFSVPFGETRVLVKAVRGALEDLGFPPAIPRYNDVPGRTKYEVAALFDHAKEQPL